MLAWIDRPAPSPRATFLALVAAITLIAFPFRWTGDEENYLLLALRTIAPDRLGPWNAVFDQSRERIVGFWLMGRLVQFAGFGVAHAILLALSIGLIAWGLTQLSEWLELSALDAAVGVMLFWLSGQTLMGGEWMLGAEEPKTIAHGLALIGFAAAAWRRWRAATLWFAAAFYIHFLVAGYWLLAACALLIAGGDRRMAARILGATLVLALPLLVLGIKGQIAGHSVPQPPGMPNAEIIYSLIRAPHHVAPFAAQGGWKHQAQVGLFDAALLAMGALAIGQTAPPRLRALGWLVAGLGIYLFVAIGASWLDRDTGYLGKFYLFRPACIMLLLAIFGGLAAWRPTSIDRPSTRMMPALALLIVFLTVGAVEWRPAQEPPFDADALAMVAEVRQHLPRGTVLLLDPATDTATGFARALDRPTVVQWKFAPSNPADIYRWWGLIQMRRAAFAGDCARIPPAVKFLLATPATLPAVQKCGTTFWSNHTYTLIALPAQPKLEYRIAIREPARPVGTARDG